MATTKVTANVLADNSVTQAKLADDAVGADELAANAVVNASIASGAAIDMDKLDGDSLANAITDFAQDDLVILSDTSDSGNLVKITTSNFEDAIFGNISGDATVAAGGVLTIANNAIETAMINADAVTGAKIADDAIDSEHYTDGSIDTAHLADGAITAAKIADGTVVEAEIADNAVTTAKINADAVTGAKIADDAVDSEHYTDGSIDTAHIADNNVTFDKLENRYTAKVEKSDTSGAVSIDWSAGTTFEFTASLTGALELDFTNFKQGQTIGIYGLTGSQTITLDSDAATSETFNKVGGVDYDGASSNYLQIVCVDDSATAVFNYSVATYTADTTI
jgi:hypothetical protein